jgi:alkylation response protein AidB-like acyl-CoA dehydrogenase
MPVQTAHAYSIVRSAIEYTECYDSGYLAQALAENPPTLMDFEFTEEQRALRESTHGLLNAKVSLADARRLRDGAEDFDTKLWQMGAELGWPALAVPEDHGGLGQQLVDLAVVAVEHGRFLLPSPLMPTVVVADALTGTAVSDRTEMLDELLAGSSTAAWAFGERAERWSIASLELRADAIAAGYVLAGEKAHVQDAASARWLLVDAMLDDQPARFIVPTASAGITFHREKTLDITRAYYDIAFDQVALPHDSLLMSGPHAACAIERTMQFATVLASAELIGIGERLLEMTVQYVKDRVQFDRPIGSFQAVKHKCATMRMWVQAATAATYYAAMSVDALAQDRARAVSVAKAYTSEAICRAAGEALQLHGGVGFTWEHDLHLYIRRARTNALLYGDPTHHRELLCRTLEHSGEESIACRG